MPGKKIALIGSSNHLTNSTANFGSMAGLAPTKNVRPWISGLHGYKYTRAAANGSNWLTGESINALEKANGCGLHGDKDKGKMCIEYIGYTKNVTQPYYRGPRLG